MRMFNFNIVYIIGKKYTTYNSLSWRPIIGDNNPGSRIKDVKE